MKPKQQLLEEFAREEDDSYFLEVLVDIRDVLQTLLGEVQDYVKPIILDLVVANEKDDGVDVA